MTRLLRSIRPVLRDAQIAYLEWALREIDPLHPDVPQIVLAIHRLRAERAAS